MRPRELWRPIGILLVAMGIVAAVAGAAGSAMGQTQIYYFHTLFPGDAQLSTLPQAEQVAFQADAYSHGASYLSGALGAIVVMWWISRRRGKVPI